MLPPHCNHSCAISSKKKGAEGRDSTVIVLGEKNPFSENSSRCLIISQRSNGQPYLYKTSRKTMHFKRSIAAPNKIWALSCRQKENGYWVCTCGTGHSLSPPQGWDMREAHVSIYGTEWKSWRKIPKAMLALRTNDQRITSGHWWPSDKVSLWRNTFYSFTCFHESKNEESVEWANQVGMWNTQ